MRLQLWDTAGQERFGSLIPSYIRDSAGAVIVYDVTSRQSFNAALKWVERVRQEREVFGGDAQHRFVLCIVGNKTDLAEKREVSSEEGEAKAAEVGALFCEVSAKQGTHIKALFRKLASAAAAAVSDADAGGPAPPPNSSTGLPPLPPSGRKGGIDGVSGGAISAAARGKPSVDPFLVTPSRMAAAARQQRAREEGTEAPEGGGGGCGGYC